jgi:hypothetical protein
VKCAKLTKHLPEWAADLWMPASIRRERNIFAAPESPTCYPFRRSKWIISGGNLKFAKTSIVCIKNGYSKHAKLRWQPPVIFFGAAFNRSTKTSSQWPMIRTNVWTRRIISRKSLDEKARRVNRRFGSSAPEVQTDESIFKEASRIKKWPKASQIDLGGKTRDAPLW